MNKEEIKKQRQEIGAALKKSREENGISLHSTGLRYEVGKAIEDGSKSYTIDSFLIYVDAIGGKFFQEDKEA